MDDRNRLATWTNFAAARAWRPSGLVIGTEQVVTFSVP
jgi:hypothetical protein